MPEILPKHKLLLLDNLVGLFWQNSAKREFIDTGYATRVLHETLSINEANLAASADIENNAISNSYQTELEIQKQGNTLQIADDSGKKSVDYVTRQAGFDLDQIIQSSVADREAKVKTETYRTDTAVTLAAQRNQFKTDSATIEGEYRMAIAGLDVANIKATSDIKISGLGAKSAIDIMGIGREAQVEADSITSYSNAAINLGDISAIAEISSINQTGQADIQYIGLDAIQQSAFIDVNNQAEINSDAATSGQRIAAIGQRSVIDVGGINNAALLDVAFQKLDTQATIDNESAQTAIAIGAAQAQGALEVGYEAQASGYRITSIALENAARIENISATAAIENLGDMAISAIENNATLETARLDVANDSLINALDIQDSNSQTADRINALLTQAQTRAGSELVIASAETQADLLAAQQSAFYIAQGTAVRVGDIQAEAQENITNIQRSSDVHATAVVSEALATYNSVVTNARIAADYQTQATDYINGISSSAANQKSRYTYVEALAHANTLKYHYSVRATDTTTPDLPSLDSGGITIFNSPTVKPSIPGFL